MEYSENQIRRIECAFSKVEGMIKNYNRDLVREKRADYVAYSQDSVTVRMDVLRFFIGCEHNYIRALVAVDAVRKQIPFFPLSLVKIIEEALQEFLIEWQIHDSHWVLKSSDRKFTQTYLEMKSRYGFSLPT